MDIKAVKKYLRNNDVVILGPFIDIYDFKLDGPFGHGSKLIKILSIAMSDGIHGKRLIGSNIFEV